MSKFKFKFITVFLFLSMLAQYGTFYAANNLAKVQDLNFVSDNAKNIPNNLKNISQNIFNKQQIGLAIKSFYEKKVLFWSIVSGVSVIVLVLVLAKLLSRSPKGPKNPGDGDGGKVEVKPGEKKEVELKEFARVEKKEQVEVKPEVKKEETLKKEETPKEEKKEQVKEAEKIVEGLNSSIEAEKKVNEIFEELKKKEQEEKGLEGHEKKDDKIVEQKEEVKKDPSKDTLDLINFIKEEAPKKEPVKKEAPKKEPVKEEAIKEKKEEGANEQDGEVKDEPELLFIKKDVNLLGVDSEDTLRKKQKLIKWLEENKEEKKEVFEKDEAKEESEKGERKEEGPRPRDSNFSGISVSSSSGSDDCYNSLDTNSLGDFEYKNSSVNFKFLKKNWFCLFYKEERSKFLEKFSKEQKEEIKALEVRHEEINESKKKLKELAVIFKKKSKEISKSLYNAVKKSADKYKIKKQDIILKKPRHKKYLICRLKEIINNYSFEDFSDVLQMCFIKESNDTLKKEVTQEDFTLFGKEPSRTLAEISGLYEKVNLKEVFDN